MSKNMLAAAVTEFGKSLVLGDWPIPEVGPGQILVKTEACGVCHTDVHAWNGDWPLKPSLPFIPGHEGIGRVVALGTGVTAVKEGDRVGVIAINLRFPEGKLFGNFAISFLGAFGSASPWFRRQFREDRPEQPGKSLQELPPVALLLVPRGKNARRS